MKEFYNPKTMEAIKKEWKDPEDPKDIDFSQRKSFEGFEVDENNYPINPVEDKEAEGKGVLYRWGPNLAGDPMVTKIEDNERYILLITRKSGKLAFPGGMQDKGEDLRDTIARELQEETNLNLDFSKTIEIYSGYVEDPRNTKNAWIETLALNYELTDEEKELLNPIAGDDAQAVQWVKIANVQESDLHASHYKILQKLNQKYE